MPQSWRLRYQYGNSWKRVQADPNADGLVRDVWNPLTFPAVEPTVLRLEVQLQPERAGGILEWKVG